MQNHQPSTGETSFVHELVARHGEVVGGNALRLVLGFPTIDAMKRAIERGTLPLPTFFVPGRRGRFALTVDIAKYLVEIRSASRANDRGDAKQEDPSNG